MFTFKSLCVVLCFSMFFLGCAQKNEIKNEVRNGIEKIKKNKEKIKENKYCNKYRKIMTHASLYIKKEFKEGYFLSEDILGAKAQLFLIKNKALSIFAKNINSANDSYLRNYNLAKKNKCKVKKFKFLPLERIKREIKNKTDQENK